MTQRYREAFIFLGIGALATTALGVPLRMWLRCSAVQSQDLDMLAAPSREGVAGCFFVVCVLSLCELLLVGSSKVTPYFAQEPSFSSEFAALRRIGLTRRWVAYAVTRATVLGFASVWYWAVSWFTRCYWPDARGSLFIATVTLAMALPALGYRGILLIAAGGLRQMSRYSTTQQKVAMEGEPIFTTAVARFCYTIIFHGVVWPMVFGYGLWAYGTVLLGMDLLQWSINRR